MPFVVSGVEPHLEIPNAMRDLIELDFSSLCSLEMEMAAFLIKTFVCSDNVRLLIKIYL